MLKRIWRFKLSNCVRPSHFYLLTSGLEAKLFYLVISLSHFLSFPFAQGLSHGLLLSPRGELFNFSWLSSSHFSPFHIQPPQTTKKTESRLNWIFRLSLRFFHVSGFFDFLMRLRRESTIFFILSQWLARVYQFKFVRHFPDLTEQKRKWDYSGCAVHLVLSTFHP